MPKKGSSHPKASGSRQRSEKYSAKFTARQGKNHRRTDDSRPESAIDDVAIGSQEEDGDAELVNPVSLTGCIEPTVRS